MSRREAEAEDLVEKRGKVEVYRTLKLSEAGKPDIVVAAGTAIKLHSGEGDPYETTKSGGKSYRLPLYWLYRPYEARRGRERKGGENEMWAPKQARRESLLSSSPEQTTLHKLLRGGT